MIWRKRKKRPQRAWFTREKGESVAHLVLGCVVVGSRCVVGEPGMGWRLYAIFSRGSTSGLVGALVGLLGVFCCELCFLSGKQALASGFWPYASGPLGEQPTRVHALPCAASGFSAHHGVHELGAGQALSRPGGGGFLSDDGLDHALVGGLRVVRCQRV